MMSVTPADVDMGEGGVHLGWQKEGAVVLLFAGRWDCLEGQGRQGLKIYKIVNQ